MGQTVDIRETFFQECEDLLDALSEGLVQIEGQLDDPGRDPETVNAVFRAVHSIKGGSGAFGLSALMRFAHRFENVLDLLRSGKIIPDAVLLSLFQRCGDYLADLIHAARDGGEADLATGEALTVKLAQFENEGLPPATQTANPGPLEALGPSPEDLGFVPLALSFDLDLETDGALDDANSDAGGGYRISFRPERQLYANGHDPAILLAALRDLGTVKATIDASALPEFESLDPTESYLAWSIHLDSSDGQHVVEEVFEFVDGLCEIDIRRQAQSPAPTAEAIPAPSPMAPRLVRSPVDAATAPQEEATAKPAPIPSEEPAPTVTGAENDRRVPVPAPAARPTIRVDLERVDRLINAVGELVINQAVLSQRISQAGISQRSVIGSGLDEFRSLAREIQESVMAIRAQTIKPMFQRMARIVREAADLSAKSVRLITEGETTEVDKTVIEGLAEPLTHMIRNAVDHGIECTEDRLRAGKPEMGTIRLSSAHRSGRVVIEVADDGAGINRPRVRQIAVDKGLIPADAELTDAETDKLLFLPGFSTVSKVTSLSGRGVGMDVVKRAIHDLGGRVAIASTPGKGTTFTISLPLTLAVVDAMVVNVAGQTMVIPISSILETLRPSPNELQALLDGGLLVSVRGELVPIVDLGSVFGHRAPLKSLDGSILLLVEVDNAQRYALAVDDIHDQRQVVIKGLEENYGRVPGIAAATILGDGKIALIIDPEDVVRVALPQARPLVPLEVA